MILNGFSFSLIILILFSISLPVPGQMHYTNYQSIYGDVEQSYLGWHVDLEGDLVVAGTNRFLNDEGFGGAYLFRRHADDTWRTEATLKISRPLVANEVIQDVQIESDVVMIVTFLGAYFFEKPDGGWRDMEETAKFTGTGGYTMRAAQFLDNRLLVLQTSITADPPTLVGLYEKSGPSWVTGGLVKAFSQDDKNTDIACGNCILLSDDFFAVSNTRATPGNVFVYEQAENGSWPDLPTAKYEPDAMIDTYRFGQSLASDGRTLFIGSAQDRANHTDASLFLVEKAGQSWQSASLSPQLVFDRDDVENPTFSLHIKGDSLFVGRQLAVDEHSPLALLYPKPVTGWGGLTGDGISLKLLNGRNELVDGLMLGLGFDLEEDYAVFGNWLGERKTRPMEHQGEVAFVKLAATCQPVTEIADPVVRIGQTGLNVVELAWDAPGYSFRTEIAYREAGIGGAYNTLLSSGQRELLTNLRPNTTYEYKLRNICGVFGLPDTTAYSTPRQFTTGMGGIATLVNVPVRGLEDVDPDLVERLVVDDSTAVVGLQGFHLLVLENQDSVWRRVATLQPASPPTFHNLAIDGHTIVAANLPFNSGTLEDNSGQLFIWEKPATGWEDMEETAKVVIPAIDDGLNLFGFSLEISGSTIVANTLQNADPLFSNFQGSVFVVEKTNGKWGEGPPAVLTADMNGRMAELGRHYAFFGFSTSFVEDFIVGSRPVFINNNAPRFTALDEFKRSPLGFLKPSSGWASENESFEIPTVNPGYLLAEEQSFEDLSGAGNAVAMQEAASSPLFPFGVRFDVSIIELAQNDIWQDASRVKAIHLLPNLFNDYPLINLSEDRLLITNNNVFSQGKSNNIAIYHKTSDTWADASLALVHTITNSDGLDPRMLRSFDHSGPFYGFLQLRANTIEDKLQLFTENRYCLMPENISATVSGEGPSPAVTINWESLPSSSSWEVAYRIVGSQEPFRLAPASEKTVTISNLSYGTTYEYRVKSLCGNYPDFPVSAPTALQQFTTPCLPPANLNSAATTANDNSFEVSLTWDQPHENEGFEIVIKLGDSVVTDLQSTDTELTLNSGLLFNEEYRFQVRSVCATSSGSFYSAFSEGTFIIDEFIPEVLNLYPNPTTGRATIQVPVSQVDLALDYQIVDNLGKTLSTGVITRNNFEIDLTHLSPGTYNLIISKPKENTVLRVVKY